jgi:hypothetical protein
MTCSCSYCSKNSQFKKPVVKIKSASSYNRRNKLSELGSLIKGTSYPAISYPNRAKGASSSNVDKSQKLKELGKLIKGYYVAA